MENNTQNAVSQKGPLIQTPVNPIPQSPAPEATIIVQPQTTKKTFLKVGLIIFIIILVVGVGALGYIYFKNLPQKSVAVVSSPSPSQPIASSSATTEQDQLNQQLNAVAQNNSNTSDFSQIDSEINQL